MYNRNAIDVWNICSYRVNGMVMDTPGAAAAIGPLFLLPSFKIHFHQIRASPGENKASPAYTVLCKPDSAAAASWSFHRL